MASRTAHAPGSRLCRGKVNFNINVLVHPLGRAMSQPSCRTAAAGAGAEGALVVTKPTLFDVPVSNNGARVRSRTQQF
jgi:hypothetical protein